MKALVARVAAALVALPLTALPATAQSNGPITLLVGYSAGGSADFAARVIAPEIASRIGRPVVVENATGASGMIALQKLINNPADTATIYYGGQDTVAVPMLNAKVKIDWEKDTIAVGMTTLTSMVLAVPEASPIKDVAGYIAAAKANPGGVAVGTPGIATAQHFLLEMLSSGAGIKLLHAPYRGGAQVSNDLLGGSIDSAVFTFSTVQPFVLQGKARAILISTAERSPQMPNVPTLSEVKGFEGQSLPIWQGIFVKAGTSPAFVAKLDEAIRAGLADPQVQKRYADAGFTARPLDSATFAAFVKVQAKTYRTIIDTAGIKIE
jgi:tripartite-type tricarboxylate transporter receptor subunit TctC